MAPPAYLRASALATLFGISERTVRRLIADGSFPSIKVGGARLVPMALLENRLATALPRDLADSDGDQIDK